VGRGGEKVSLIPARLMQCVHKILFLLIKHKHILKTST
jgi:hypothetical protein